ncbi:MAG TPA: SMC-Scp complex subunit ScpB [Kribbella sp.]|nr:SMC-Scp complex subunit ScpB [Kribbella sp.]
MTEQHDSSTDLRSSAADSVAGEALESVTDTERVVVPDESAESEGSAPAGGELAESDASAWADGESAESEAAAGGVPAAEAIGMDDASRSGEELGADSEGNHPAESGDEDHLEPGQTALAVEAEVVIDDDTMRRALEAILMVTDEPLPVLTLARAVGRPTADVSAALRTLAEEYTDQGRGFDLREVAGGWRYYTRDGAAQYVERFVLDGQQARLTQAALETLAVVAYKQPVSRARVSAVRGVNVDGVMRTLVSRGLVEEAGADTESQATLYRTTSYFLERMGMQSLEDLPELAPYLPEVDDMEEELAAQAAPPPHPDTADPAALATEPDAGATGSAATEAAAAEAAATGAAAAGSEVGAGSEVAVESEAAAAESGSVEQLVPGESQVSESDTGDQPVPDPSDVPEPDPSDVPEPDPSDVPEPDPSDELAGAAGRQEAAPYEGPAPAAHAGPAPAAHAGPAPAGHDGTAPGVDDEPGAAPTQPPPAEEAAEPEPGVPAPYEMTGERTRDAGSSGGSWSNRDDD